MKALREPGSIGRFKAGYGAAGINRDKKFVRACM